MKIREKICKYLKMITFRRVKNALSVLRKEGWSGIKYHFYLVKDKEKESDKDCCKEYDTCIISEEDAKRVWKVEELEPIQFEIQENPLVSIIIPVYNQVIYTYHCLKFIRKYTENIPYEIIVGDDCSTDITASLETLVKGIRVVHHKERCQFVVNCNRISAEARGKYLVFLNNDTQVQKEWLKALLDVMETMENVGLVGSKLVCPDGMVQEAGGIVWRDAHVLQFGKGKWTGGEVLNFMRETDYISGASIMLRKELWDELGGFDEQFAPAYYEDVDLAFRMKEKGYKIIYQPKSEVIHFEGATEGRNKELEKRIEKNRKKFVKKWRNVLEKQYYRKDEYPLAIREIEKELLKNSRLNENFGC